jgi:hypothetical protein
MVNYPGIVSCDDETYHKAHLEERFFELLASVPLKGLTVSSCMRRYKGQDDGRHTHARTHTHVDMTNARYATTSLARRSEQSQRVRLPDDRP